MTIDLSQWHPIASSSDLPLRHVYQAQLHGREFAVWRADDQYVNVWENRCLHRGVRLSVGLNDGKELKCLYHGWRYSNRSAGCTYIPAHPADAPARTICNRTYPGVEEKGLVWSAVDPAGDFELPEVLKGCDPLVLRPIPLNAAPGLALSRLADLKLEGGTSRQIASTGSYSHLAFDGLDLPELVLFVQPVDAHRCVLRGVLKAVPADPAGTLRQFNTALNRLRTLIEAAAAEAPAPEPIAVDFRPIDEELASMPEISRSGPKAELRVTVARKWETSEGVAAFRLEPLSGALPTFQPGAHIDVHLPNGMARQYSITNGPGEGGHYTIAVKREPDSRGGSECLHNAVQTGDVLAISAPRNNFPLRRDAVKVTLVAGGIGITPMLAMARALDAQGIAFELHYFAQSKAHLSFPELLNELGDSVVTHLGLNPAETSAKLNEILADYGFARHLYICGPGPMLEATRDVAAKQGWPDEAVHFEYFKNTQEIDDSSTFEVALARSAMTLQVPAGKTILEVLQENGIEAPSSCEQGACGTCLATVIEGEPDHQDVYLTPTEKAAGDKIITCVSRSKSNRLVLDI
ncbi:oxidoreductase [Leisingera sp. ANG-M1]|uniref:Rieske 2Fe-2S domain-containing protein n=1 Tax=Leisingera sp. ANG-M1 TaxID=1577895 RepID=UPI00057EADAC|nr:Rieske 2Fe-2S domain-containing protein [Leisingera sp. ANG-M1]KIC07679.1 oxidoreductase [Leisingera sp. ANG-M1]